MKVLSITGGAGNMYCGSCMRDNALALEIRRQGHDVLLLPLYTPTRTEDANASHSRVFFGGISIYLQQLSAIFRWTPKFLDRLWDRPSVIAAFTGRGVTVDPAHLGALTVSMLEGRDGRQRKEVDHLCEWLRAEPPPDLVTLPYTLLIALARPIKQATGRPVVCSLQGEELFLEGLHEPWRSQSLALIRRQIPEVDAFIAISRYEAGFMENYLGIPPSKIRVTPLGIRTEGHDPEPRPRSETFHIGYLARIAPEKGLHVLAEAVEILKRLPGAPPCSLDAIGYLAPENRPYLEKIAHKVNYQGEVDRDGKLAFLKSIDVLSLPATYDEPKGLPILEAMASGVPVVQPRRGSFPELIETTGGGLLVEPDSPKALAEALLEIWQNPTLAQSLAQSGSAAVRRHHTLEEMARRTLDVYHQATAR